MHLTCSNGYGCFNFFFPHCQEDFTPERQPRRCWFNPVKSDYGGNPDDQQAMVRYLLDDLVTSPWRAMMVSKKGPILCWARALKGSSLASEREHDRTWSHILYNLFPISISSVNWIRLFFFGWRYRISVVPWWGEKTRSCILWCTLTVKFGVIRGRHREIVGDEMQISFELFLGNPTTHIVKK